MRDIRKETETQCGDFASSDAPEVLSRQFDATICKTESRKCDILYTMHYSLLRTLLAAVLLGAGSLFSPVPASAVVPQTYDGPQTRTFTGNYSYNRPGRPFVRFGFTITSVRRDRSARGTYYIQGTIREQRSDFGPRVPFLTSRFSGKYVDGERGRGWIQFTKRYDFGGSPVMYEGRLDRRSGRFEGSWDVRGSREGGSFNLMDITQRGR